MPSLRNPRHEKFAFELAELELRGERGARAEAYKRAGFVPNPDNARRLANKRPVRERVQCLVAERLEYANIRLERVAIEVDRVGRANMRDFYRPEVDKDGKRTGRAELIPVFDLPHELAAAIKSVKLGDDGRVTYELHDRNQANFALLKFLGGVPEPEPTARVNIFNVLSIEDQRALADALEAFPEGPSIDGEGNPREPVPSGEAT